MSPAQRPAWRSRVGLVAGAVLAVSVASLLSVGAQGPLAWILPTLITAAAVGVSGWAVWQNRRRRAEYEARLTSWAAAEAAVAERLRIARDLHDIVSHGLGLITVRAAAARHVAADGGDAAQAFAQIEKAGRDATAELRRMLLLLRTPDDATVPRTPVESLAELPDVVRDAAAAGLRVELAVDVPGEVSQGVQVAVCRTVREALSNTARHAGPTDVRVHVHRDGAAVVVTISDRGPRGAWRPAAGAGHGLLGLRERVQGLGGTLHAGGLEGGFRVTARLPDEAPT